MHTCIHSHRLKRSSHSCPRWVNADNKTHPACTRSKNEVVSDLALWELKHGKGSIRGQARTFVDLLEEDTRVPRDCLLAVMDDRVGWRKRTTGEGGSTEVNQVVVVAIVKATVQQL